MWAFNGNLRVPTLKKWYYNGSMFWPYPYRRIDECEYLWLVMTLDLLIVKDVRGGGNLTSLLTVAPKHHSFG
jgi:hypothetical protein